MRIALDATYSVDPHPSGITIYSRELLTGLAERHATDKLAFAYRWKQFRRAPRPLLKNVQRRLLLPPLSPFRADLFHALNQRLDWRPANRTVSTFHDLFVMTAEYSSAEFRARFTEQAKRAAEHSDRIVAVSEFTASQVTALLGFDRARIRVIPHGVHIPKRSEEGARERTVLFVGALQQRKNIIRLVEAFERLPREWRLTLAGSTNGYGAGAILQRIEASRARERIDILGYVEGPELDRLYRRASIFAFPSLDEGFGIPVLEAMAHGTPVLTSDRPSLREVAGDAALLIDAKDVDQIEQALVRLTADPDLASYFSDRGLARAKQFSWDRAVDATYDLYRELVDSSSA
ncbi:MAG TPA: glycosyltransferase family 1 protein [Bryobacteraceae bacterium]|nr:glycosyltransferase family 1 protein [Bryobacteraceae bacterium]